jgi:hypothetical protein
MWSRYRVFSKSFHFWVSFITFCNFLKIPSVVKGESSGFGAVLGSNLGWVTLFLSDLEQDT